jgi:hypothetical protein
MSHFIGLCFGDCWESNLNPYDEGLEVEPYVAYTKEEAIDEVKRRHAFDYEWAIKTLENKSTPERQRKHAESIVERGLFISYEDAWKVAQEWGYEIDEDGNLLSRYNPDSRWDWYSIGGRWSGFLYTKEKDDEGNPIRVDQATFGEIDWDYMIDNGNIPFCFVTADGEWVEKGEMGWWGMVSNETPNESWKETFKRYINSIEDTDCLVTAIDFHI